VDLVTTTAGDLRRARSAASGRRLLAATIVLLLLVTGGGPVVAEAPAATETCAVSAGAGAQPAGAVAGGDADVALPLLAGGTETYAASFRILFALLVLAVLLESGLAVIFNWRVYQTFVGGGVKTPVTVACAVLLASVFHLDLVTDLVNLYTPEGFPKGPVGTFLTALVLAGGSSGVNKVLVALGFRKAPPPEEARPKPARTEGWLSVRYVGTHAGPVTVLIGEPPNPQAVAEISSRRARGRFAQLVLRDGSRFPSGGGYSYDAGKPCRVELRDRAGQPIPNAVWGPYPVAPGAVIDIEFV